MPESTPKKMGLKTSLRNALRKTLLLQRDALFMQASFITPFVLKGRKAELSFKSFLPSTFFVRAYPAAPKSHLDFEIPSGHSPSLFTESMQLKLTVTPSSTKELHSTVAHDNLVHSLHEVQQASREPNCHR